MDCASRVTCRSRKWPTTTRSPLLCASLCLSSEPLLAAMFVSNQPIFCRLLAHMFPVRRRALWWVQPHSVVPVLPSPDLRPTVSHRLVPTAHVYTLCT